MKKNTYVSPIIRFSGDRNLKAIKILLDLTPQARESAGIQAIPFDRYHNIAVSVLTEKSMETISLPTAIELLRGRVSADTIKQLHVAASVVPEIIADIEAEAADGKLEILSRSSTDILTNDYVEDQEINYHLVPPTAEWLQSRFIWGKSCAADKSWEPIMVKCLLDTDPNMLVTLNRIIVVGSDEDIGPICEEMGVDASEFPDVITFNEMDGKSAISCCWGERSSVVINMAAIEKANKEICAEDGLETPDFWFEHRGIIVSLFHSIRFVGLTRNPFLNEETYPDKLAQDDAVEQWARKNYEQLFPYV